MSGSTFVGECGVMECVFRRSRPLIPIGSRPLFRRDVGQHSDPKLAIVPVGYRPGLAADRSIVLISWDSGAVKLDKLNRMTKRLARVESKWAAGNDRNVVGRL